LLQHGAHVDIANQRQALYGPLWENMTSSTKPEIHNIFQCRQKRIEDRPQVTHIENLVKFVPAIFVRPFVKRFALCYEAVVCPVCLSCPSVSQSLTSVYCGRTVGWIKMPLGTGVGLGPGHIVLDRDPASYWKRPYFWAHLYCGQRAGWIRIPLGMEIASAQVMLC